MAGLQRQQPQRVFYSGSSDLKIDRSILKKQEVVAKSIENDKTVYKLTDKAFSLPSLRILFFEIDAYHQILREFFKEGEVIVTIEHRETREKESLLYWDLEPKYLAQKSENELVRAFDKWLTPIILYTIVQELGSSSGWTQVVPRLVNKIRNLIKQKDLDNFETALRTVYSGHLIHMSQNDSISVIESLDEILRDVEKQQQVHAHFTLCISVNEVTEILD